MRSGATAAFLAFLCPGLGHYYAGLPRRAVRVVLIQLAAYLPVVLVVGYGIGLSAITLALVLVLALVVFIAVIADAFKRAAENPLTATRPKVSRLLLWFFVITAAWALADQGVKGRRQAFRSPSSSMEPTLLVGDYLLMEKGITPRRGDVLVFRYPNNPTVDYIKRCVGVPGDTLLFRDRVLRRNGEPIEEPYAQYGDIRSSRPALDRFGPLVVPEGQLFMLGDNRDFSSDSRVWGFLDMELVHGRASHIYWSWDGREKSARWNRIGDRIH